MNHLVTEIVQDIHFKRTKVIAPITLAATAILGSKKDFLTNGILYNVLVVGFETSKHCEMRRKKIYNVFFFKERKRCTHFLGFPPVDVLESDQSALNIPDPEDSLFPMALASIDPLRKQYFHN